MMMLINAWWTTMAGFVQLAVFGWLCFCALRLARRRLRGGRYIAFGAIVGMMGRGLQLTTLWTATLQTPLSWQAFRSLVWFALNLSWLPIIVYGFWLLTVQLLAERR